MGNLRTITILNLTMLCLSTASLQARAEAESGDLAVMSTPGEPDAVSIQMNGAHSGVTQFAKGMKFPLQEAWRIKFNGPVSSPLIADGRVFVTVGNSEEYGSTLFALSAKNGAILWSVAIDGTYFWSGAAYESGQVFVLNFDGLLKAFDEKSGRLNWSVQVANEYFVTSPPVARNGMVYVEGDGSGTLTAYRTATGELRWTQSIAAGDGAPAVTSQGVFTYSPCQVYAFNPASGAPLWRFSGDCEGGGGSTPVFANDSVYVSDPSGSGNQILSSSTGALIGTFEEYAGPPTVGKSEAFFLANGTLRAMSIPAKKVLWSFAGDGGLAQLPIQIDNTVFVGSSSGLLWGLDRTTGKEVWSTNIGAPIAGNTCCTGPNTGLAASNGLLVVPATDLLVAYR
jgi:outer membrane protein assembly factor BamB